MVREQSQRQHRTNLEMFGFFTLSELRLRNGFHALDFRWVKKFLNGFISPYFAKASKDRPHLRRNRIKERTINLINVRISLLLKFSVTYFTNYIF